LDAREYVIFIKDSRTHRNLHSFPPRRSSDLGGKNGTYVNDRRITEPALLRAGDRVRLGSTVLIVNGSEPNSVEFDDRPLLHGARSEEHTSELQSRVDLVCRLLLEKKNKKQQH